MPSNHLILCHSLLLLPSVFPSIRVFSYELAHRIRWPHYWGFSFSISLSNEYSGLISFRIDWFDLLAVQRTLKSLQHDSSKIITLCSDSLPVSWLFTLGGPNIATSASVLPMNIQVFSLGLTGLISLLSKGLSRVFSSATNQKHQFFDAQPSLWFS